MNSGNSKPYKLKIDTQHGMNILMVGSTVLSSETAYLRTYINRPISTGEGLWYSKGKNDEN